jgi:hypothetical protein
MNISGKRSTTPHNRVLTGWKGLKRPSEPYHKILSYIRAIKPKVIRNGIYRIKRPSGMYYNIYIDNRIIERRRVKGSRMSWTQAKDIFQRNKTLKKGFRRDIERMKNAFEISIHSKANITSYGDLEGKSMRKPTIRRIVTRGGEDITPYQYVISYVTPGGNVISARSQMSGRKFALTSDQMRHEAWNNFMMRLSAFNNGNYKDSKSGTVDQGMDDFSKLSDKERGSIREGYVYYRYYK